MAPPRALVLDLGEVLVLAQAPEAMPAMARTAGVALEALHAAYWGERFPYDLHGDGPRFWREVLARCGAPAPTGEQLASLMEQDGRSWTRYHEPVWDLALAFRAAGGRTAMLSNGVPEVMRFVRQDRPLERWFDTVVVSCEVGVAKPDPAIYALTVERLGVAPGEALFVDDRAVNVEGARAAGLRALHYAGPGALAALRRAIEG
ncbi:MAG: HAD family phosphatase [Anaeromyxobacter sp.]